MNTPYSHRLFNMIDREDIMLLISTPYLMGVQLEQVFPKVLFLFIICFEQSPLADITRTVRIEESIYFLSPCQYTQVPQYFVSKVKSVDIMNYLSF